MPDYVLNQLETIVQKNLSIFQSSEPRLVHRQFEI